MQSKPQAMLNLPLPAGTASPFSPFLPFLRGGLVGDAACKKHRSRGGKISAGVKKVHGAGDHEKAQQSATLVPDISRRPLGI